MLIIYLNFMYHWFTKIPQNRAHQSKYVISAGLVIMGVGSLITHSWVIWSLSIQTKNCLIKRDRSRKFCCMTYVSLGDMLRKLCSKQHILTDENEGKNLPFSADFSNTCWFICNLLWYLPSTNDMWWVSLILNFIWRVLADMCLVLKSLIFWPWRITFCWKNIFGHFLRKLICLFCFWKCELWLDLSNKTQKKHDSAGCAHEHFIQASYEKQPTDYQ